MVRYHAEEGVQVGGYDGDRERIEASLYRAARPSSSLSWLLMTRIALGSRETTVARNWAMNWFCILDAQSDACTLSNLCEVAGAAGVGVLSWCKMLERPGEGLDSSWEVGEGFYRALS